MKRLVLLLLFVFGIGQLWAQSYDLLITSKRDTFACHIDSVSSDMLFVKLRFKNKWHSTHIKKTDILAYYLDTLTRKDLYFTGHNSEFARKEVSSDYMHSNMLTFLPTAYPLKQGDFYYNTNFLFLHDFQFGVTDRFTLRVGANILFWPFYILPTYSFPINDNSAISVGDFLIVFVDGFTGNIPYVTYSYGTKHQHFTAGFGLWTSNISSVEPLSTSAAFSLAGSIQLAPRVYFVTENYAFSYKSDSEAIYENHNQRVEEFARKNFVAFGLSGIRFVGKRNNRRCFQIGLLYINQNNGKTPSKYNTSGWHTDGDTNDSEFAVLPLISFSVRFGARYK